MRQDMQKIIVEKPRYGGDRSIHKPRRPGTEWEHYPTKEGIRRRWKDRKSLSDNLRPLYAYLDKQVGRPWDKVWSEICARLDFRSVLGFHVKSHIDQHVERHVKLVDDGVAYEKHQRSSWGPPLPIDGLYVHPVTGLVCQQRRPKRRRPGNPYEADRRILPDGRQFHRYDGQWYEVTLTERRTTIRITERSWRGLVERDYDLAEVGDVLRTPTSKLEARYGQRLVAVAKRQLSRKERRRYGLESILPGAGRMDTRSW
jgi:hypothetical protein